jgi:hypothetical protein
MPNIPGSITTATMLCCISHMRDKQRQHVSLNLHCRMLHPICGMHHPIYSMPSHTSSMHQSISAMSKSFSACFSWNHTQHASSHLLYVQHNVVCFSWHHMQRGSRPTHLQHAFPDITRSMLHLIFSMSNSFAACFSWHHTQHASSHHLYAQFIFGMLFLTSNAAWFIPSSQCPTHLQYAFPDITCSMLHPISFMSNSFAACFSWHQTQHNSSHLLYTCLTHLQHAFPNITLPLLESVQFGN